MARFIYSILRFVPDTARGEQVNIGLVVGRPDTRQWCRLLDPEPTHARCLDVDGVLDSVLDHLRRWDVTALDEEALMDHYRASQGLIGLSRPAPIIAEDVESAIAVIIDEFFPHMEYPASPRPQSPRT